MRLVRFDRQSNREPDHNSNHISDLWADVLRSDDITNGFANHLHPNRLAFDLADSVADGTE